MAQRSRLNDISREAYVRGARSHCAGDESPTGARHDIEGSQRLLREHDDTLLIVDAITGLRHHAPRRGWLGVDVIIGGSQKALMIPLAWHTVP